LNRSIYNTNEEDIVIDADELKRVLRSLRPALRPKENFTVPGFDSN